MSLRIDLDILQSISTFQIRELKLEDPWAQRCAPPGHVFAKDDMGRRCGLAPPPNMQEIMKKAAEDAKEFISKKHVSFGEILHFLRKSSKTQKVTR